MGRYDNLKQKYHLYNISMTVLRLQLEKWVILKCMGFK